MPTNHVQTLLAADIPDPTDFPTNELRQLDASLRCTICSEFYDAPVTLSCGHCFCSLCIREHVSREAQCPSCRKPTAETQLRLNPALEEVVAAWKTSRPTVLRLSREEQRYINSERTPRRSRSPNANSAKRKRNTRSESTDSGIVCVAGPSNSSPVSSNDRRSSKRRDMEPSSDIGEEELEPTSLVSCPVCRRAVEFQLINSHMDGPDCGKTLVSKARSRAPKSGTKNEWSRILGKNSLEKSRRTETSDSEDASMERLPKVSYAVLKDKALKELLVSQKLPTAGDRNTWISRHQRWVMMYNANLDKSEGNRRRLAELRTDLKKWEEDRKAPKRVVENTAAHETTYRDDFKRLVEEARRTGVAKPTGPSLCTVQQEDHVDVTIVHDSEEEQLL